MKQKKNSKAFGVRGAVRRAFTLAEVLITLGIIGIVAAMTIPSLVMKYKEKSWATASSVFEQKLEQSLRLMNTSEQLSGRKTTENFLKTLSNYMKITKICDNNNLNQCFRDEFVDTTDSVLTLNELKTSKQIALEDWGTNTLGVQFANGVSALVAYNKDCKVDAFSNNSPVMSCVSMIYDTNGTSTPNKMSKDIHNINTNNQLAVIATINGVRITNIANMGKYPPIDCKNKTDKDYKYCYGSTSTSSDRFAGAAKYCGGKENMASDEDLAKIAQYLYNDDTSINATNKEQLLMDATTNTKRAEELNGYGFPIEDSSNYDFIIWSSTGFQSGLAYDRTFKTSSTGRTYRSRYGFGPIAVCVKH